MRLQVTTGNVGIASELLRAIYALYKEFLSYAAFRLPYHMAPHQRTLVRSL